MLLNTVVLTDPFTQHDPNTSNDAGKKSATASLHIWLKRNQYEMSTGIGVQMYGRERSGLFLLED